MTLYKNIGADERRALHDFGQSASHKAVDRISNFSPAPPLISFQDRLTDLDVSLHKRSTAFKHLRTVTKWPRLPTSTPQSLRTQSSPTPCSPSLNRGQLKQSVGYKTRQTPTTGTSRKIGMQAFNLPNPASSDVETLSASQGCGPEAKTTTSTSDRYETCLLFSHACLTLQIPRHLLATHLLKTPPSSEPSAFIIHPSNFDAFAPRILLNALQSASSQPSISRDEAICRLDAVQLFPVHNLPNAAQAIGKVSDSLQEIQEKRQHSNNTHPIILIVVGLDTLAEGIIRASNPVKGTALLAATLRNLTRMSRAYASYLSVILVNTNGLGPPHFESHQQPEMKQPQVLPEEDTRPAREDGLHSIFQVAGPPLLFNLLMRTLDQGIDTHILLSDVKAATVAEVIKARVGSGLGKWGIWISKQ